MSLFAVNLLLAIVWAGLTNSSSLLNLAAGYLLGLAALWLAQPLFGPSERYFTRTLRIAQLILFFAYDLLASSLRVAWDVVTPTDQSNPAIIELPLTVKSDLEILLVANLISLTPGTLSLDVSPDREILYVHAMFADDPDAVADDLRNGMEFMVRRVFA